MREFIVVVYVIINIIAFLYIRKKKLLGRDSADKKFSFKDIILIIVNILLSPAWLWSMTIYIWDIITAKAKETEKMMFFLLLFFSISISYPIVMQILKSYFQ